MSADRADSKDEHGLTRKGLLPGTVGLFGATVIGVSCVAPAYTLTASLGPIAAEVGTHAPAIILVGFLPMLLVALGYRELNRAMPDSGTSFTWVTRAFGPWAGWLAGWGLASSTVLVLSNTAGVAVDFFYLMLSQIVGDPALAQLTADPAINIATCFVFMAIAAFISWRGMETTKAVQYVLVGFQVVVLTLFAFVALYKLKGGIAYDPTPIRLDWFNPLSAGSLSSIAAGLAVSIFIFWGWDVTLTMNEETKGARATPGRAAALTVLVTAVLYLFATSASLGFAGVGTGTFGLGNPEVQRNAFLALAGPILGSFALLISVAVLSSSAASLQSTMVSPSRTLLAMGHYGALPAPLTRLSRRFQTPEVAIFASTGISWAFYAIMRYLSENVLWDTVTALGIMICFYYSITAFACVWYFRRQWRKSKANFLNQLLAPLLGGIALAVLFVATLSDSMRPEFGSGSQIGGIGLVFIIGMGIIAIGLVTMAGMAVARPDFFRGETLSVGVSDGREDKGLDELPV